MGPLDVSLPCALTTSRMRPLSPTSFCGMQSQKQLSLQINGEPISTTSEITAMFTVRTSWILQLLHEKYRRNLDTCRIQSSWDRWEKILDTCRIQSSEERWEKNLDTCRIQSSEDRWEKNLDTCRIQSSEERWEKNLDTCRIQSSEERWEKNGRQLECRFGTFHVAETKTANIGPRQTENIDC